MAAAAEAAATCHVITAKKRQEFEALLLLHGRWNPQTWAQYADWEESNGDFPRARSVYARALNFDSRYAFLWLKYSEFEILHGNIHEARNVLESAILELPRADDIWRRYVRFEEENDDMARARGVYEQWMERFPGQQAWLSFVEFELRHNETKRAREIFERFVMNHCIANIWSHYGDFEMKGGDLSKAEEFYKKACSLSVNNADRGSDGAHLMVDHNDNMNLKRKIFQICNDLERFEC